ncbi:ribonuclease HIII [Bacillaceae bacterium W0354]
MGQSVIKIDQDSMKKVEQYYQDYKLSKQPPHTIFVAKKNGCTITAYTSGKVMFQGENFQEEANLWSNTVESQHEKTSSQSRVMPNFIEGAHVGSDEAGTGDYFGPITVGAVFATKKQQDLLRELGVRDSKALKDETIIQIVKDILLTDIVYSTVTLNNEKYNSLQKKGWTQGRMKAWMHHHAIKHVLNKMEGQPDGILIDQFCEPSIFYNHVRKTGETPIEHLTFLTKAESISIPVAAASMLARYRYLQEMDKLSKLVGFDLQKGASKIVDNQINKIIHNQGEAFLNRIAKVHFANTEKAKRL